jgi:hypothetical protein
LVLFVLSFSQFERRNFREVGPSCDPKKHLGFRKLWSFVSSVQGSHLKNDFSHPLGFDAISMSFLTFTPEESFFMTWEHVHEKFCAQKILIIQ